MLHVLVMNWMNRKKKAHNLLIIVSPRAPNQAGISLNALMSPAACIAAAPGGYFGHCLAHCQSDFLCVCRIIHHLHRHQPAPTINLPDLYQRTAQETEMSPQCRRVPVCIWSNLKTHERQRGSTAAENILLQV